MQFKPEFEPPWWPSDVWRWEDVTHFRQKPRYPGPGSLSQFLTTVIITALEGKIQHLEFTCVKWQI